MKKNSKRIYVLTVNATTMIEEHRKRKMHSTGYCIPVTKSHNVWTNVVRYVAFLKQNYH